jgi:hypothetical protein
MIIFGGGILGILFIVAITVLIFLVIAIYNSLVQLKIRARI